MTLPMCPLRTKLSQTTFEEEYGCCGGINFYSLGANAELCLRCHVPKLGDELLRCAYSDIYTLIVKNSDGPSITYDIHCSARPNDLRCRNCPDQTKQAYDLNRMPDTRP